MTHLEAGTRTHATLVAQISELSQLNRKGSDALHEAELLLAEAEATLDTVEAKTFLSATGTVGERNVVARLASVEARHDRDVARAGVNRVKMRVKQIESELIALATQAKLLQAEQRL